MNRVKKILIERDGIFALEADNLIEETREEMEEAIEAGHYLEAEDIFMDNLGLEPDYMFDILEVW